MAERSGACYGLPGRAGQRSPFVDQRHMSHPQSADTPRMSTGARPAWVREEALSTWHLGPRVAYFHCEGAPRLQIGLRAAADRPAPHRLRR